MREPTQAAGKAMGKLRAAKEVIQGHAGIFKRLAEEHGEVSVMLKRVAASTPDSDVRRELFPKIRQELLSHAKAEESEFYSLLRSREETSELVADSLEDHQEMEDLLAELSAMEPSSASWKDTFDRLVVAVQEHVKQEEDELFSEASDILSKEEAQEIEQRFLASKADFMAKLT
jgi:hemerythrin superfamily protein